MNFGESASHLRKLNRYLLGFPGTFTLDSINIKRIPACEVFGLYADLATRSQRE